MIKNNKGYTLMELMVTVLIIAILTGIGVPYYLTSVEKTKVATYIPILKSLHDGVIQYYPQENEFPPSLKNLHVLMADNDWVYSGKTAAKNDGTCRVALQDEAEPYDISLTCKRGGVDDWKLQFNFVLGPSGLAPGLRYFVVLSPNAGRQKQLARVAVSTNWPADGTNRYKL